MKRFLKIAGITLASVVGLVLLAVFTACYLVFTPERLTPIVNRVTDSLITCQKSIDEVNLTFFRTFPCFGVEIKGLYVIHPMEGAPSDTVLAVPDLLVGLDIVKAVKGDIDVYRFTLNDVEANAYIAADGKANFDILNLSPDTVKEEKDTAGWRLRSICFREALRINARQLCFADDKDSLQAGLKDLTLTLEEKQDTLDGYRLTLDAYKILFNLRGQTYADGLSLHVVLPVALTDSNTCLHINGTQLGINDFTVRLDGTVASPDWATRRYDCDLRVQTNDWQISSVRAVLPAQYSALWPKDVTADGKLQLSAHLYGRYDSVTMPLADARVLLKDAQGHYNLKVLPYRFDDIAADIAAHLDWNNKARSTATLNRLAVRTGETGVTLSGTVTDILKNQTAFALDNPLCDLTADLNVNLPDADYWLQKDSAASWIKGTLAGKVNIKTRLNDVTKFNLNRMQMNGDLAVKNLNLLYADSTLAQADWLTVLFTAPVAGITDKDILSADCKMGFEALHAQLLTANLNAVAQSGTVKAGIKIDTKDSTNLPIVGAAFHISDIVADMDTLHAHAVNMDGKAIAKASQRNTTGQQEVFVSFLADALQANQGDALKAQTGKVEISASARYNKNADRFILKFNPHLKFNLQQAHANIALLGVPVDVPQIKFEYSNREFNIDTSRIVIGKSDFSLGGNLTGMSRWLRHEGDLTGTLRFTSDYTDVDELLALANRFNRNSGHVETDSTTAQVPDTVQENKERGPFMVPKNVDLAFQTVIKNAKIEDEIMKNLGGNLYIREDKVILEEIGFICDAAKLQLTAMYKSPRRDHLYMGFDVHMIDIDLQQLIHMIPQLDTLVPMLRSFRGGAQFHIAAETYLNSQYKLKTSTLRGACSIEGNNLVVLDSETFSKISKILLFNPKTENKIDSLSVQMAVYKDHLTVYPFCISLDNYMVALGGSHYVDMSFDYHASLLKPFYIGVDIGGTMDDLDIKPAKCRYAQDFRPIIHKDTQTQAAEMRQLISNSLKKNVIIK